MSQRASPQPDAIICAVSKRQEHGEKALQSNKHSKTEPHCGGRPIVTKILEWTDQGSHWLIVQALLNTGCTTLLLSLACAD